MTKMKMSKEFGKFKNLCRAGLGRCTPLIPALGKQRQVDLYEFKGSLVYIGNFRLAIAT